MNIFKPNAVGTAASLKYAVSCPKCSWRMEAAPFVPIVGGGADTRLLQYIGKLKEHVERTHPDVGMQIGAFSCYLIAAAFKLEDPLLLKMKSDLRYALHRQTTARVVSDEIISERAAKIAEHEGLSKETEDAIAFVLRDMRDVLMEQGEYAPKQPAEAPVTLETVR